LRPARSGLQSKECGIGKVHVAKSENSLRSSGLPRKATGPELGPSGRILSWPEEAVIWNNSRVDFDALQRRMVTAKAELPTLPHHLPATFAAFDVPECWMKSPPRKAF
jgi:hypothetical protein